MEYTSAPHTEDVSGRVVPGRVIHPRGDPLLADGIHGRPPLEVDRIHRQIFQMDILHHACHLILREYIKKNRNQKPESEYQIL